MRDRASDDTPRAIRLILVRHGESYANIEDRFQGQTDTGLTPRGRDQAQRVAKYLVGTYPEVSGVIASDLGRVAATAEPYLTLTGSRAQQDPRLRELDTGTWSGRTFADIAQAFPRELAAMKAGEDIRRGGGETFAELRARVAASLDHHAGRVAADGHADGDRPAASNSRTIIVFTHGGPIRVAVAEALGLPADGHLLLSPPVNCSVTVLTRHVDGDGAAHKSDLVAYNTPSVVADAARAE